MYQVRNFRPRQTSTPFPPKSAVVTLLVSLLRYHASPTIDRVGERIAADQGGKLTLDLDLEAFARAVRVDRHAVNQGTEALHQGSAVVLGLGVLGNAGGQRFDRFDIAIEGCRMEGDDFRSFLQRRDFSFDLQALRFEVCDPLAGVVLLDDPLTPCRCSVAARSQCERALIRDVSASPLRRLPGAASLRCTCGPSSRSAAGPSTHHAFR